MGVCFIYVFNMYFTIVISTSENGVKYPYYKYKFSFNKEVKYDFIEYKKK